MKQPGGGGYTSRLLKLAGMRRIQSDDRGTKQREGKNKRLNFSFSSDPNA